MREIIFRGRRTQSDIDIFGKKDSIWVEGCYIKDDGYVDGCSDFIRVIYNSARWMHSIEPETIGQYTGMVDESGIKIYEGDIVTIVQEPDDERFVVEYDNDLTRFVVSSGTVIIALGSYGSRDIEVVGNIHDNPKMIKVIYG